MAENFQNILTITGQQKKAAAEAGGSPVNITHFKVGDSNGTYYTPLETQIDLVHTRYTGSFTDNSGSQILVNSSALNEVLYKCFIPADIGGFTVRELGLFDADDDLILICKLPAQDKFALDAGLYQPLTFTPKIIYTNPATQAVLTPSSQIIATQTYVNEQITEISQQVDEGIASHDNSLNAHNSLFTQLESVVSEISTYPHIPYSVNYGNTNANGYADLISKVSDSEVAFKVGGVYPNMGVTFPNGKHYEISSIPNVTGLNDNALYTFVIFEENLVKLEDGTYSAIVTPAKVGYDAVQRIPALTSASHDGYTATYSGSLGFNPYNVFDNDTNTAASYNQSVYIYDPAQFRPEASGYSTFVLSMDTAKNIEYLVINSSPYFQPGWFNWGGYSMKIQTSTDGGATWSAESTINLTSPQIKIDILQNINAIKFQFSLCTSAYSDENMNNMWYVLKYLNIKDIDVFERVSYAGGTLTEDIKEPESPVNGDLWLDLSGRPHMPYTWQNGVKVEKQFLKPGEDMKTGGTLGTPISYAFNGRTYFKQLAPVYPSITQFPCNLGTTSIKVSSWLVNKISQWNYTPGQKSPLMGYRSGSTPFDPIQVYSKNIIEINISSHALCVTDKSTTILQYVNYPSQENKWDVELLLERGF